MFRTQASRAPAIPGEIDDPDLPLAALFGAWPQAAQAFWARRMLCPGCPIAPFHTVIDACAEYALDEAAFRAEIRAAVAAEPVADPVADPVPDSDPDADPVGAPGVSPPPRSAAPAGEAPSR